jgi:eukaryotic-like serine/threonine-protein kinase
MPPLQAGQVVGPYRIARQLGQGGQATAYLAEDQRLGRPVVLKVLRPEASDQAARRRFEREACLCSALDHPNIASVYDLGETGGMPYLVMQYVEGKTLKDLLGGRPLALPSALSIAIQLADGLAVAHAAGIVHRDLKPGNVIVSTSGQARILDFGLAKLLDPGPRGLTDETLTTMGAGYGTMGYGSPEQATGEPVDHRSDVFSLGVVLYEMLAGRKPFLGRNPLELLHAVVNQPALSLAERVRGCPPELAAIVDRALAKRPRDRYQTMAALRDDLKAVLRRVSHEPGPGQGDGVLFPPERLRRSWSPGAALARLWTRRRLPVTAPAARSAVGVAEAAAGRDTVPPAWSGEVKKTLAVLPFQNLTGDAAFDSLGLALADGLITVLAPQEGLMVRPWAYVARYANKVLEPERVASDLDVSWLLSGTFVRNADKLRLSTQLLSPATGELAWGERMDVPAADALAAQDALGDRVLAALRLHLAPAKEEHAEPPATRNAAAYEHYLRGREMLGHFVLRSYDVADLELAIRLLNESAGLDPDFASVHGIMARAYLLHAQGYGGPEYLRLAERSVRRTLELEPASVKGRLQEAYVNLLDGDRERAWATLAELEQEAPDYPGVLELSAHLQRLEGGHDAALAIYDRLQARSPDDAVLVAYKKARVLLQAGRWPEARVELGAARRLAPHHAMVDALLALADLYEGRLEQGSRALDELMLRQPSFDGVRPLQAWAAALRGRDDAGELITDAVRDAARVDPDAAFWLGGALAQMGQQDEALTFLRQAARLGLQDRSLFTGSPLLAPLRPRPELEALVAGLAAGPLRAAPARSGSEAPS